MIKFSKLTMMFWLWVDVLSCNLKDEVRKLQEKTQLKSNVALRSRYKLIINVLLKAKKKDGEAEEALHQKKKPQRESVVIRRLLFLVYVSSKALEKVIVYQSVSNKCPFI